LDSSLKVKARNFMLRLRHGVGCLSKKTSMRITQLDLRYNDSPVINYNEEPNSSLVLQGKRAPDVVIDSSKRLYQYFHPTRHNVLLFTGKAPKSDALFALKEIQEALNMMYADSMRVLVITQNKADIIKRGIF